MNLKKISLTNTPVNDVSALESLKQLTWVGLFGTPVSDEQVTALQQALPNCKIER